MTVWLLDGNVLLALANPVSPHHQRAHDWFSDVQRFATCPITQGTLLRVHGKMVADPRLASAWRVLEALAVHPAHEFWPDSINYLDVAHAPLQGGAQVTDAYLAALARHHGGRVATFDRAFAQLYPDAVTQIGAA